MYNCSSANNLHVFFLLSANPAKPNNYLAPNKIIAQRGKDAVLWCSTTAKPFPSVTWINPNNRGFPDNRLTVNTSLVPGTFRVNSTLTIRNVSLVDIGSYVCEFSNPRGSRRGHGIVLAIDGKG